MDATALLPVFLAALAILGIAVAAMAIGVMMKRPCLRGSCGGSGGDRPRRAEALLRDLPEPQALAPLGKPRPGRVP